MNYIKPNIYSTFKICLFSITLYSPFLFNSKLILKYFPWGLIATKLLSLIKHKRQFSNPKLILVKLHSLLKYPWKKKSGNPLKILLLLEGIILLELFSLISLKEFSIE